MRALRQWKRQRMVRIAGRDLLAIADLRDVSGALSDLAGACLEVSVAIAVPSVEFAVIAMGKLGGHELNYSSDVDVMFVHEGDQSEADRAARAVLATMSQPTPDGIVFRTDADAASRRSIRSVESHARKLRGVLGAVGADLGAPSAHQGATRSPGRPSSAERSSSAPRRSCGRTTLDPGAVREVRAMKARTEAMLQSKGLSEREVKRGPGGIRDIEFAVQLLQLVHGRQDPSIRSRSTLDALEQLAAGGYVTTHDASALDAAYTWLRTVEHRLQLVDEHQTHTLPTDGPTLTHLARVLGFRDRTRASPHSTRSMLAHQQQQAVVRSIHEKLFFAPILDTLAGVGSALDRRRRGTAERLRLPRRRADPLGTPRAHRRPHAPLARDATAAPGDPRVALGCARSRPRPPAAAPPDRGLHALVHRRPPVPRDARRRRARVPHPGLEPRARTRAAPPAGVPRRTRRRRRTDRASRRAPSSSMSRSTRSTGGRTTRLGATGSAGSSGASSCASARATCSAFA